ncbi:hypothetical protein KUTeg_000080 [Tegillarca granosa]|uniref:Clathrin light chain n=1 Tax=Tegillarca granosa TaxID=220873 RepID=A0ABQ9FWH4_TEGGR|nr:hypothetical protein KUTeg_000080 [Tegillarca granosa]
MKMADFDAFETADQPPQTQEEDPAAAFLAREQTELAGLEDDNFGDENPAAEEQTDFDPFSGGQEQTNAGQGEMFGDEAQDLENDQWLRIF